VVLQLGSSSFETQIGRLPVLTLGLYFKRETHCDARHPFANP
jgi:hypothetical protein